MAAPNPTPTPTTQQMPQQHHEVPDWEGGDATTLNNGKKRFSLFGGGASTGIGKTNLFATHSDKAEVAGAGATTTTKVSMTERFNRAFPPNKTYFGRSRKVFLLGILGLLFLLVLALGLGLGLGLRSSSSSKNLPLPSNTDTFTGDITYYDPGLGACGVTSSSSDAICAVSHIIFDAASTSSNPNANPLCGRKIRITRFNEQTNKQASIDVTVVDRCVGCKAEDVDLSLSMFEKLAAESLGRTTASWAWLD